MQTPWQPWLHCSSGSRPCVCWKWGLRYRLGVRGPGEVKGNAGDPSTEKNEPSHFKYTSRDADPPEAHPQTQDKSLAPSKLSGRRMVSLE